MRRVYKYPLPIADAFNLELPAGADLLHVAEQAGTAYMWTMVNPDAAPTVRQFALRGTGHPIENDDADLSYIGSFVMREQFVFHLFEVLP